MKAKYVLILLGIIVIIACSIGIIISSIFQMKKTKKYKECVKIIKDKDDKLLSVNDNLSPEYINSIDSSIDVNTLMPKLYNKYVKLQKKLNSLNPNLDDVTTGFIKEMYENRIASFKNKNYFEIVDKINLLEYSIVEFEKDKLKFRIKIKCLDYKMSNDKIIEGSNKKFVDEIIIIEYMNVEGDWLISKLNVAFKN